MRRRAVLRMLAMLAPSMAVTAVSRRARGGQSAATLVTDHRVSPPVFADRDRIYWAVRDGILSVSKRGGTPTPLISGNVDPLALFGDRLIFQESPRDASSIDPTSDIKVCRTGAPAAITTLARGRRAIYGLAADASGMYFQEIQDTPQNLILLFHLPWSGGKAREIAEVPDQPMDLVADATHLYWGSSDGGIYSVPKQGGVPDLVGSGPGATDSLTIDDRFVYFTGGETGTLSRAPKRGGRTVRLAKAALSTDHADLRLRGQLETVLLHGAYAYYVDNDIFADNATVRRLPRGGGPAEAVVERSECRIEELLTVGKLWIWVERFKVSGAEDRYRIMSRPL